MIKLPLSFDSSSSLAQVALARLEGRRVVQQGVATAGGGVTTAVTKNGRASSSSSSITTTSRRVTMERLANACRDSSGDSMVVAIRMAATAIIRAKIQKRRTRNHYYTKMAVFSPASLLDALMEVSCLKVSKAAKNASTAASTSWSNVGDSSVSSVSLCNSVWLDVFFLDCFLVSSFFCFLFLFCLKLKARNT